MPRVAKPKVKKLTVAELKRKMEIGTILTMVDFHGQGVNKRRVVAGISSTFVKMTGDGVKDGEHTYLNWPKSTELVGTEDGFIINGKYGSLKYVWGEVKDEGRVGTEVETEVSEVAG